MTVLNGVKYKAGLTLTIAGTELPELLLDHSTESEEMPDIADVAIPLAEGPTSATVDTTGARVLQVLANGKVDLHLVDDAGSSVSLRLADLPPNPDSATNPYTTGFVGAVERIVSVRLVNQDVDTPRACRVRQAH